ncbi:hypothetical protein BpHYR1_035500 [Brachionus plicatilis]|uniref:Uncharacterized protein n=1 Tax=Brachionus plicatilis TaxID=10195 RepID=A0A3M7R4M6_BRAPC|nr:hypothetical protein BpHYR1_035500 [Brachionus plicatilis]
MYIKPARMFIKSNPKIRGRLAFKSTIMEPSPRLLDYLNLFHKNHFSIFPQNQVFGWSNIQKDVFLIILPAAAAAISSFQYQRRFYSQHNTKKNKILMRHKNHLFAKIWFLLKKNCVLIALLKILKLIYFYSLSSSVPSADLIIENHFVTITIIFTKHRKFTLYNGGQSEEKAKVKNSLYYDFLYYDIVPWKMKLVYFE